MYNLTQYISAALHDGLINPQIIIDDYKNRHKAKVVEVGFDKEKIYAQAKKAKERNTIVQFLMIFPSLYIIVNFSNFNDLESIIPISLVVATILFVKQININNKLKEIAADNSEDNINSQNVIISGSYSPFVGYGNDLNSWSFVVDLKKPNSVGNPTQEINVLEFLDFVSVNIRHNIYDALISDKLFVNGRDIRHNPLFMNSVMSEPNVNVSLQTMVNYIEQSDAHIRHYRHIEIPMWNAQVNLSVFLKFTIVGEQLFSEARYFLLSPVKEELMVLNNAVARSGFEYYKSLIITSLFKSLYSWLSGFILLISWFFNIQTAIATAIFGDLESKIKLKDETYNYGRTISIRELLSSGFYHRYFQILDKDLNYKVTQHIIIDSIIEYLDSKGISTEDIKQTQTAIINSGVMVNGGTVNAEQMSVGIGAKVTNTINKFNPIKS
jgi:hypothetical protein